MEFKKVAITGHASGIGKYFYDYFKDKCEVRGFDLINGYDISKDIGIIVDESLDCDLFINNACIDQDSAQVRLASHWFSTHVNDPFFILQMSSATVRMLDNRGPDVLNSYREGKIALENIHNKINLENYSCKSIVISPGIVETSKSSTFDKFISKIYDNLKEDNSLILPEDIVNITVKNLELINDRYFPSLIEICNKKIRL